MVLSGDSELARKSIPCVHSAAAASHSTAPPTRPYTMSGFHQEAQVAASTAALPLLESPWEPGFLASPVPAPLEFPTECHSRAFQVEFLNPQGCRNRQAWQCSPPLTQPLSAELLCQWVSGNRGQYHTKALGHSHYRFYSTFLPWTLELGFFSGREETFTCECVKGSPKAQD